jgi:threonine dehydratase
LVIDRRLNAIMIYDISKGEIMSLHSMFAKSEIPEFDEIEQAAQRLKGNLPRTPLLESDSVNAAVGGRLLIKAETLMPTGSFKVRGAWNCIALLDSEARSKGIVALSSGNHGQAVAWASRKVSIPRAVVFMPSTTPATKVTRTRDWGGEVRFFDRTTADRMALVADAVANEGLSYVPPFDHRDIIAGAGTAALEVAEDLKKTGTGLDNFVSACSGGGLIAGSALALERSSPQTKVWGVEPENFDDTLRSLQQGAIVSIPGIEHSICDAVLALKPGELTFRINQRRLSGVLTGSDLLALRGMKVAFDEFGLAAEPGGALALGVVMANRELTAGKTTVVVLSGRNVDHDLYSSALLNS